MYLNLAIKTFILYAFIIFVYRLMGKKELGELGIGDLIVTVLIAELAAISIEETDNSIWMSIIPILVLVTSEIIISLVSLKSSRIRRIIDGKPSVIIKKGKIKFSIMTKLRYTLDDLVMQLRNKGIANIEDVDYAVLETNGELSVFQKNKNYPLPLILDGEIDEEVLKEINKNRIWLSKMLCKKNIKLENVFYAFYTKNKLFIVDKNDLI